MKKYLLAISFVCIGASAAGAQDLVYEPVNPSFGGNPFNSAHLLALANAQNDYERPEEETSASSDLDRFVRSLQSRLLSSLSTQVANAIFGEDAQDQGTIVFGDQTISFVRTLDGIELTITEADGSTTTITIPVLTTEENNEEEGSQSKYSLTASNDSDLLFETSTTSNSLNSTPLLTQPIQQPIR